MGRKKIQILRIQDDRTKQVCKVLLSNLFNARGLPELTDFYAGHV